MAINPWLSCPTFTEFNETEYRIYASLHYFVTFVYLLLLILVVANIWKIIIKQERWKTLPLLCFYVFAFIAISARLYDLCFFCAKRGTAHNFDNFLTLILPLAKIWAGLF